MPRINSGLSHARQRSFAFLDNSGVPSPCLRVGEPVSLIPFLWLGWAFLRLLQVGSSCVDVMSQNALASCNFINTAIIGVEGILFRRCILPMIAPINPGSCRSRTSSAVLQGSFMLRGILFSHRCSSPSVLSHLTASGRQPALCSAQRLLTHAPSAYVSDREAGCESVQ